MPKGSQPRHMELEFDGAESNNLIPFLTTLIFCTPILRFYKQLAVLFDILVITASPTCLQSYKSEVWRWSDFQILKRYL